MTAGFCLPESSADMVTREFVQQLETRRDTIRDRCQTILDRAKAAGRDTLSPEEDAEVHQHIGDMRGLNERIIDETAELERARVPEHLSKLGTGRPGVVPHTSGRYGVPHTAGQLAPLEFGHDEMRRLQGAAQRGDPCRLEQRAFSTADSLIPASLFPYPIEHIHENRLLDRLPGIAFDTPAITFIRHISTTGNAAPTAEGALKNELVFNTDALTLPAVKLAGNSGLSYEIINDFEAFHQYAGVELQRQVIDQENQQLLTGSGTAPNMTGFFNTTGILTHDCTTDTGTNVTAWDSLNVALNLLRNGPALAVGNLFVFNPNDWNAIRRIKDAYGRFLVSADPSDDQVNQAWGVDVFADVWCPAGKGLLLDTTKFGYVGVREPMAMRIGYAGTDFQQNILRFIAEERLTLCVTRPSAVCSITNLP
jgi:HK97 family phage major capsid protein